MMAASGLEVQGSCKIELAKLNNTGTEFHLKVTPLGNNSCWLGSYLSRAYWLEAAIFETSSSGCLCLKGHAEYISKRLGSSLCLSKDSSASEL